MRALLKKLEVWSLGALAVFVLIVSGLDLIPQVAATPFFARLDYEVIASVVLSLIAVHLVSEHFADSELRDTLPIEVDRIIRSLEGVSVRVFADGVELDKYIARRIREARSEVCDLSWKNTISTQYGLSARVRSTKSYESAVKDVSGKITYREVFVFNDERRLDKLRHRLRENRPGYSCRYFPGGAELMLPRLQFVLIDNEEVIFASSAYPKRCAVEHGDLCEIFKFHFNEIWQAATPLKEGLRINTAEVRRVLPDYESA